MKKIIYSIMLIATCNVISAQASGNWYYQKSKSSTEKYDYDFSGYLQMQNSAQAYYQVTSSNDTVIYLEVKALLNVKPDGFIMILGLSQVAKDLETAYELIDQRTKNFVAGAGLTEDKYYIDFISQTPIFSREKKIFSKKYIEIPKGYEIKKNIHIYYTDRKFSDTYIKLAAKNEIYDVIKVEHIVNNHQASLQTLQKECIKLLKSYMQNLTELGISFDADYKSIEENNYCTFPNSRYSLFTSYMPVNYSTLDPTLTETSFINPNEKINLFYDRLPYNTYDIIINPEIVEPCVQFSKSMKIKIVLKKKL